MTSAELQLVKDVAQIVNYLALSISGPLALLSYWRAKRREQADREYRIYDELDNKFLEYQKLALQHDLELIDISDADPRVGSGTSPRKKQELVASGIGFSLFQRAFLMFQSSSDQFKQRQWRGWEEYFMQFLARPTVRDAWLLCRGHCDARFQDYVDGKLVERMRTDGEDPAVIYAYHKTGLLVRDATWHLFSPEQQKAWDEALAEFRARAA